MRLTFFRPLCRLAGVAALIAMPVAVAAEGLFEPVARVNDRVVTKYEHEQRIAFYEALNAPGNLPDFALETLIDERLQMEAAAQMGVDVSQEQVIAGMEEFASRGNLTIEGLVDALAEEGVARETFEDFVRVGLVWREVVGGRFGPQSQVTEAEVDRAIALGAAEGGVRVLLSEIILPAADERQRAAARALAVDIAAITSFDQFTTAARNYSASNSRTRGGRLEWLPLGNLPPALQGMVLTMRPGEVTDPIPVPNAIALFQFRGLQETGIPNPETVAVEFARYFIPGGRTEQALAEARKIAAQLDTCDDLYGVAQGQPADRLQRDTVPTSDLSGEIARELARLDDNEISTNLVTADGQTLILLMLCGRTQALDEEVSRDQIRDNLFNTRLASYATGYLAELRADAVIEYP